jgi:two-component system, OmpR family, sensor histidine kinase KdpD
MIKSLRFRTEKAWLFQYLAVILVVATVSAICFLFKDIIGYRLVSFILLFVVSILALFFGTGPILLASTLSAGIWDYFFIPPSFTLHIGETEDTLLLVMFFVVALLNGILTSRIRRQELNARKREERTLALYQLSKELLAATGLPEVVLVAEKYFKEYFDIDRTIFFGEKGELMKDNNLNGGEQTVTEEDKQIALWVYENSVKAGRYSENFSSSNGSFYPLKGSQKCLGVVCVWYTEELTHAEGQFMETLIALIAGKVEREFLSTMAKEAYVLSESDKLYKTLFNSISHELRIPVATIMGATDTLLSDRYPEQTRKRLYFEMSQASVRLNRLIENLLNMSRLESGHLSPRYDWCDVQDLINKVSGSLKQELSHYNFIQEIPEDMPLVYIDFGLMEQVLHNLILNATQYAPEGTVISVSFLYDRSGRLIVKVMDQGKGFSPAELNLLFNKFYRGESSFSGGTGLGLSIVKGFAEAQGGSVSAGNKEGGGAVITIEIPVKISEMSENKQN